MARAKERGEDLRLGLRKGDGSDGEERLVLFPFFARPKPKIPFLGLSLLRNQTKTLATQAKRPYALWNLTLTKKLFLNGRITASCHRNVFLALFQTLQTKKL